MMPLFDILWPLLYILWPLLLWGPRSEVLDGYLYAFLAAGGVVALLLLLKLIRS